MLRSTGPPGRAAERVKNCRWFSQKRITLPRAEAGRTIVKRPFASGQRLETRLDHTRRAGNADDEALVDRTCVRRRLADRVPAAASELDVHRRRMEAVERRVRADVAAVRRAAVCNSDRQRHRVGRGLVRRGEERRVVTALVGRGRERPEVAILGARDHDGVRDRVSARIRDRAGQLVGLQRHGRRCRACGVVHPPGDHGRPVRAPGRVQGVDAVADTEGAGGAEQRAALGRGQRATWTVAEPSPATRTWCLRASVSSAS